MNRHTGGWRLGLMALLSMGLTATAVERPFMLWTRDEAAALRRRIETEDWAREAYARLLKEGGRGGTFRNLFRYNVMGDENAGQAEKKYLLGIIGTHPRQFEKLESGGRHYDCYLDALRYDAVYDLLLPEERVRIEATFREYVAYQLQDKKSYTRTSWLPNMQWPRPMAAFIMAVALQDRDLITQTWNSRCGFKWYLDEYLGDGRFYMEEFGKQYSMIGEMLLYCRGLRRLGLDELGYGYRGRGGATMRSYIESILDVGYPRVETGTTRPHYPKVTMGDARGRGLEGAPPYVFQHAIVEGQIPGRTNSEPSWLGANMNGRDHKNTKVDKLGPVHWFEMAHSLWPDGGFDYFLAQMRPSDAAVYTPSLYWGLTPIAPESVKAPAAPSVVALERGFALLRAEESPAYWESPAPAVALQFADYYVHYTHDCFALLGLVAFNRPIYFNRGIADGYAGKDPWTDSVRGHCGPVVDGLQPQPVGPVPVRRGMDGLVKFVALSDDPALRGDGAAPSAAVETRGAATVYPGVRTQRALFLTREYLFDVTRLTGDAPHTFDWHVHALGLPEAAAIADWKPATELDGGALYANLPTGMAQKARGDTLRYDLKDVRRLDAGAADWRVTIEQRPALDDVAATVLGAAWYGRGIGVRIHMLGEAGTRAYIGRSAEYVRREGIEPSKSTGGGANEVGGATLLVRREAPATVFVAVHEPFENKQIRIDKVKRLLQNEQGLLALVKGAGFSDLIGFQYQPDSNATLVLDAEGERVEFRDRVVVRLTAGQCTVSGDLLRARFKVPGKVDVVANGKPRPATFKDGWLTIE